MYMAETEPTGFSITGFNISCGLGFSDSEYTSGAAYAEAGFMPFAQRAREIATSVAASVR